MLYLLFDIMQIIMCYIAVLNKVIDFFEQNNEGKSPLHVAAMHGRFTGSQILIQNGNINAHPHCPPCPLQHVPVMSPPPTYTGGEIDCVDIYGNTPLHAAARYGQELLISTLLSNGANKSR